MRAVWKLIFCIFSAFLLAGCTSSEKVSSQTEMNHDFKWADSYEEENKMKDIFLTNIAEDGTVSVWNRVGKFQITNLSTEDFEYSASSLRLEFYKDGRWYVSPKNSILLWKD